MSTSLRSSPDTRGMFVPGMMLPEIDPLAITSFTPGAILHAAELNGSFASVLPLTGGTITGQLAIVALGPTVINQGITPALAITTQTYAGGPQFTWGISSFLTSGSVGGTAQEVGIASQVIKPGGANAATWHFFGNTKDISGREYGHTGANVSGEFNILCNGPDNPASGHNPGGGNRAYFNFISRTYAPVPWASNAPYALNVSTQPVTPNGFTYCCVGPGISGTSEPVWPTTPGATVSDGAVSWQCGTTIATQISRVIGVGDSSGGNVSYGAVLHVTSPVYDAILEFSGASLDTVTNPNAAAIRLASEMPIDFSGNLTTSGQNNHTLRYTIAGSGNQRLSYQANGAELFQIWDIGVCVIGTDTQNNSVLTLNSAANVPRQIRFSTAGIERWAIQTGISGGAPEAGGNSGSNFALAAFGDDGSGLGVALGANRATLALTFATAFRFATLPINAANDAAAIAAGVPFGGVYLNGSVMQVRVTP